LIFSSDLSVELPFTLTHPKPEPVVESPGGEASASTTPAAESSAAAATTTTTTTATSNKNSSDQTVPVDVNLIEFETKYACIFRFAYVK
jgi:hypothetical protein